MKQGLHPGVSLPAKGAGGPPVVLLHGFLGAPESWQPVLAALPHHGPVWCPWLPGHGPAPAAPEDWAAAVQQLAAALPAGAVLAGYSMGARLALGAALQAGSLLRATVLVAGHVGLATAAERAERLVQDAERAAALRSRPLQAFVQAWEAMPLFATQQALPRDKQVLQREARLAHDAAALTWSFEVAGLARMPDLRAGVAAARQRLHWITGALDPRFTLLAASLVRPPWVSHRVVPGAGHNLLLEAPEAVAASLADCLETT